MAKSVSRPVVFIGPTANWVWACLDRHAAADVIGAAEPGGNLPLFDHLGEPRLQDRLLRLVARRVDVGQIVAEHLHAVALRMCPRSGE